MPDDIIAFGWILHRPPLRDTWRRSWATLCIPEGHLPVLVLSDKEDGFPTASLQLHPDCTLSAVVKEMAPALLG